MACAFRKATKIASYILSCRQAIPHLIKYKTKAKPTFVLASSEPFSSSILLFRIDHTSQSSYIIVFSIRAIDPCVSIFSIRNHFCWPDQSILESDALSSLEGIRNRLIQTCSNGSSNATLKVIWSCFTVCSSSCKAVML